MSALLDDMDALIAEHGCDYSLRVHTDPGRDPTRSFSSYACERCVDLVTAIALKHLPTATDVYVSNRGVTA